MPKYRKKVFYGKSRDRIGDVLRDLCKQRGIDLIEGHAMADHIHMCLSIPPKYSVSNTVGFLKGKSAVRIYRELQGQRRMTGLHFWATGYCVSTVRLVQPPPLLLPERRIRPALPLKTMPSRTTPMPHSTLERTITGSRVARPRRRRSATVLHQVSTVPKGDMHSLGTY